MMDPALSGSDRDYSDMDDEVSVFGTVDDLSDGSRTELRLTPR